MGMQRFLVTWYGAVESHEDQLLDHFFDKWGATTFDQMYGDIENYFYMKMQDHNIGNLKYVLLAEGDIRRHHGLAIARTYSAEYTEGGAFTPPGNPEPTQEEIEALASFIESLELPPSFSKLQWRQGLLCG